MDGQTNTTKLCGAARLITKRKKTQCYVYSGFFLFSQLPDWSSYPGFNGSSWHITHYDSKCTWLDCSDTSRTLIIAQKDYIQFCTSTADGISTWNLTQGGATVPLFHSLYICSISKMSLVLIWLIFDLDQPNFVEIIARQTSKILWFWILRFLPMGNFAHWAPL